MSVSYVWPAGLPQWVRTDYAESRGSLILRTAMDKGPAKMRLRGKRPNSYKVAFEMTTAQLATLETFVLTTISSTARFGFPHPRTGTQIEVRIVPSDDGELYSIGHIGPDLFVVSMGLEEMPV